MKRARLLEALARVRRDEVVVTTMGVTRPWGRLSDHDLDFASADSAMGHAADLALGIALAVPDRGVICLNGDGSMLMSLGTLVTIAAAGAPNLTLFIIENGTYEITGNQPVPGAAGIDYAALARASGIARTFRLEDRADLDEELRVILQGPGPTCVCVTVDSEQEGPISRSSAEEARYLQSSLADWSRAFQRALSGSAHAQRAER